LWLSPRAFYASPSIPRRILIFANSNPRIAKTNKHSQTACRMEERSVETCWMCEQEISPAQHMIDEFGFACHEDCYKASLLRGTSHEQKSA
jgi:hypothetical protein